MYYSIWETGWGFMGPQGDERGLAVLTLPLPGRSEVEEELALTPEAPLIEKQSFPAPAGGTGSLLEGNNIFPPSSSGKEGLLFAGWFGGRPGSFHTEK